MLRDGRYIGNHCLFFSFPCRYFLCTSYNLSIPYRVYCSFFSSIWKGWVDWWSSGYCKKIHIHTLHHWHSSNSSIASGKHICDIHSIWVIPNYWDGETCSNHTISWNLCQLHYVTVWIMLGNVSFTILICSTYFVQVAVFVIIPTMKTKVPLVMKEVLKTIILSQYVPSLMQIYLLYKK